MINLAIFARLATDIKLIDPKIDDGSDYKIDRNIAKH